MLRTVKAKEDRSAYTKAGAAFIDAIVDIAWRDGKQTKEF
jgi:hypothetical protein